MHTEAEIGKALTASATLPPKFYFIKMEKYMKENRSFRMIKWCLNIFIIIYLIMAVYKIFITFKQINTYSKYDKSELAEIMDVNSKVLHSGSARNRKTMGMEISYKIKIKATNETIKIKSKGVNDSDFFEGRKVILSYYNLYDKNSNEYCGKSYGMTPLKKYDKGFFELGDNFYFFYDCDYPDKIVEFKIDFPNTRYDKKEIGVWTYASDREKPEGYQTDFLLDTEIDATMKSMIEIQEDIDITETLFGTTYDFNNNGKHFSVLNYGNEVKDSLVLISKETDSYHMIDYISNKENNNI